MVEEASTEGAFVRALGEEFLEEGYEGVDPRLYRGELPSGFIPDLMFRRGDEVVVIEVKRSEEHRTVSQIRRVKDEIEKKPNWRFHLFVIPHHRREQVLSDNLKDLEDRICFAERLNHDGKFEEAAVVLWMAIEASLRALLTQRQSRPNPGVSGMSMARSLYAFGDLTEEDAKRIDEASQVRNLAVHGYRLKPRKRLKKQLFAVARALAESATGRLETVG